MLHIVSDPVYTLHKTGRGHPEQPAREKAVSGALEAEGIKTTANTISPRKATQDEVLLCHSLSYFNLVCKEVGDLGPIDIKSLSMGDGDVQISKDSLDVALFAVGGVLDAVDHVMNRSGDSVFCVIRPPGHHAGISKGEGFCLFNNAAIGARYALKNYEINKILIADWDVHHGNGTQEIFYSDPAVFYFSTHEKNLYPFTGREEEIGEGAGKGTTLNCPISPGIESRIEVFRAFSHQLVEKMKDFKPELVIISAGFDAHQDDPLGHFNLVEKDFAALTKIVKQIADQYAEGRIVSVLEGGYNLEALAASCIAHCKVIS